MKFVATILVVGVLVVGLYFTASAEVVWRVTHTAPLATFRAPNDASLQFEIGNYYFGDGAYDIKKAEKYFRAALVLDPLLEGAHYQLARIYFIRSDFPLATEEINMELSLHPDFNRSYYVRALIYGYSGKLSEAEADLKKFLKWKPDSWAGNNDLAWIYFQEGKYAEASDVARAGLKISPDNPWLLNSLGVALLNMEDKKGAEEAFTKALSVIDQMTEKDWGAAYPGNDPNIYREGLSKMKESVQMNLKLLGTIDSNSPVL